MSDLQLQSALRRAALLIRNADALVIAAGAGMGVDSGLPDFRGSEGFWRAYPALGRARLSFTDVASPYTFRSNPRLAWGFYGHRLQLYRDTQPHRGFELLRTWGALKPQGYFVFTSNVDGQFQKAGFSEMHIEECHGSIHYMQCLQDCTNNTWPVTNFDPIVNPATGLLSQDLPKCPHCGSLARPNILMFDDGTWNNARTHEQLQRKREFLRSCRRPVVVEIGAGDTISTVRYFSDFLAGNRANLVRINPDLCEVSDVRDIGIRMTGLSALEAIENILLTELN